MPSSPYDFGDKMRVAMKRLPEVARECAWGLSIEYAFMAGERWSVCTADEEACLVELMAREYFRVRFHAY